MDIVTLILKNQRYYAPLNNATISTKTGITVILYVPTQTAGSYYQYPISTSEVIGKSTGQIADYSGKTMCEVIASVKIGGKTHTAKIWVDTAIVNSEAVQTVTPTTEIQPSTPIKAGSLVYEEKVPASIRKSFTNKVKDISNQLAINPNWLMLVMNSESGLDSTIQNKTYPVQGGYATGLIQFIPNTAIRMGTTTEKLKNMSAIQQLDYVYKYFAPYANKITSFYDLYLITFFPLGMGKPDNWVVESDTISRYSVAKSNPGIAPGKNYITIADFKKFTASRIPANIKAELATSEKIYKYVKDNPIKIGLGTLILLALGIIGIRKLISKY